MTLSHTEIEREVRYTYQYLTGGEFASTVQAEKIEEIYKQLLDDFQLMARYAQPLRPDERGIMTLTRQKTAALLADRVWGVDDQPSIGFGWGSPMEVRLRAISKLIGWFEIAPGKPKRGPVPPGEVEAFLGEVERDLSREYFDATGATVLPLYSSSARRDAQYRTGDQTALVCVVENLNLVDEDQLTWEQVNEFRRDEGTRTAYRRFIHWLDTSMIDKSVEYIADEINQRLERYEWSLRKHGIKTVIGTLSDTLNPKSLIGSSSAGVAVNLIAGKPIWSLLTAGGLLVGQASVSLVTALVERRDIAMNHREIAYVQQLKSELGRRPLPTSFANSAIPRPS